MQEWEESEEAEFLERVYEMTEWKSAKSGLMKSGKVRAGQFKSGQVNSGHVKLG